MSRRFLSLVLKVLKLPLYMILCHVCCIKTVSGEASNSLTLIDILKDVQRWHGYEHILIVRNQNATMTESFACGSLNDDCDDNQLVRDVMDNLQVPVLQSNEKGAFRLSTYFSARLLSLVHINGAFSQHDELLRRVATHLDQIRTSNIIFLLKYEGAKRPLLTKLFNYCWRMKMINVQALFADYRKTGTFYSYTNFPEFALETKTIRIGSAQRNPIFSYRLGNLNGYKLPYVMGGSEPRIIIYRKRSGEKILAGFVGHFIRAFAKKHNVQLEEPLPAKLGQFSPARELINAVENGTVEFSAAITFAQIPYDRHTYPYELVNWCVMLPMQPEVQYYKFYVYVFKEGVVKLIILTLVTLSFLLSSALYLAGYKTHVYYLLLHDNCLRGVLGQSFTEILSPSVTVRFIYMQICFMGLLLTTSYNSAFSTYVTSAPRYPPFHSFHEILISGKQIVAFKPEIQGFFSHATEFIKYAPMFYQVPNYKKFNKLRDSFNTKYGYMIPNTKWTIINEQQKVFSSPVFRFRDDLCLHRTVPLSFPVSENSIYKQLFQQLMLETAQSGLRQHWEQNGFLELIAAKKLSLFDLSQKNEFTAMKMEDLRYIAIGFGIMVIVEIFVFMTELCVHPCRTIYHSIGKWLKKYVNLPN